MGFGRGHDMKNISVLYLMHEYIYFITFNCKILYCGLYLECWKIVTYWTSANSSWNIKCYHWSLYHLPVLISLYKSHTFASPIPGWVDCPLLQPQLEWVRDVAGSVQRAELGSRPRLPAQPAPACPALPHSARCAASPASSVSGTLKSHKWDPHTTSCPGSPRLLPQHKNPSLRHWVILYTLFFIFQKYTIHGSYICKSHDYLLLFPLFFHSDHSKIILWYWLAFTLKYYGRGEKLLSHWEWK